MTPRWQSALAAVMIITAILACGSPGTSTSNPTQPGMDLGGVRPGVAAKWPDYIPDDIPELKGKIRNVMEAPGSHVRIFYEDLTKEQIDQYLRLLEQKGFHLVYLVYVQEGFPDNSEERLKKGDYDAVDITKGVYHMNLGYGEGDITYDIYTSGFAEAIPTSAGLDWPADLVNVVPKPERCPVETASPDSSGGYQITCRPADERVANDYIQALQAAGYLPRESAIVSPNEVYGKGDLDITVEQHSTALVLITIRRIDRSKTTWPAELMGIVPPPEGCPIKNVLALGGLHFSISCEGESEQVLPDYIDRLTSEGFVETDRMVTQSGDLVSVSLEKGNMKIRLLISSPKNFSIEVSEKP